jgi:hypothetical protein
MSHNTTTVGTAEPDVTGNIAVNVNDLSDVSTATPTNGQSLIWDSATSTWVYDALPPAAKDQYVVIGEGASVDYSTSGASSLSSIRIYDANPTNTITDAVLNKSGDWITSVTLPVGEYIIEAQVDLTFSASGYYVFNVSGTGVTSNYATIGETASTYGYGPTIVRARANITSGTSTITIAQVIASNTSAVASQGNVIAERSSLVIRKVQ